jgi:hypothetical protein
MRKALTAIFGFIANSIAVLFAVLFVLTTILILPLFNIEHILLNAGTYKRALAENGVYEQLPALAAEEIETVKTFLTNPCAKNPLGCAIEGASLELQTCLVEVLGPADYEAIGTGRMNPTKAQLTNSQYCLDQFGGGESTGETQGSGRVGSQEMAFTNNLTSKDWQTLLTWLLPPEEARVMVENMLDQVFAYLNGETDTAHVSLVALKSHLAGQSGQDLILLLLNAQPPCTEEQLAKIQAGKAGDTGQPAFCNPPQEYLVPVTSQLQTQLDSVIAGIPDEAVIIKPPSESVPSGEGSFGNDPITALNRIRMGIRFSPLLSLSLLILVTLFGIRSLKGWLRWWGIPLFIAGLIVTVIGIAILPVLDWAWVIYVLPQFPSTFSAGITSLARELADFVAQAMATRITLEAAIIGLLGLAAIIGSFFVETKLKEPAPLASTPEPKNAA